MISLNNNITIADVNPIINSKASEIYVDVSFRYGTSVWDGYVPIEYRRTGLSICFDEKANLHNYLNAVYQYLDPNNTEKWLQEQDEFWLTKPNAYVTKSFFKTLAKGGWKCGACTMPRNSTPQRRIQDLKEFGYTIATDLARYCQHCKQNTSQRILLQVPREVNLGNGYETLSATLRKRIIEVLDSIDVYENRVNLHCLPDHKFSEIRWDNSTKSLNLDTMSDEDIKNKFQLLSNQRNLQKREVCRNCFQTGVRGIIYGIPFFYQGTFSWDQTIPKTGKAAEIGCVGCAWYDIERWRQELKKLL